jgi:ferredoxin/flavodoxin---NADP+ reductase
VPTPDQVAELRRARYNGTVTYLRKLHDDLMIVRVKPDFPRPPHLPGQYCTLGLGYWEPRVEGCEQETLTPEEETKLVRRSYSISCSVEREPGRLRDLAEDDWLEFYIVLVRSNAGGRVPALTPRLFALREGDRLNIGERITGNYTLEPVGSDDDVVFLATGTGEAPHNYMLWDLLRRGHRGRILSACCVRLKADLGYWDLHQRLVARYPNYRYLPLTTRDPSITRKVYVQDLVETGELDRHLGRPLDPATAHVFLCGNPKMIGVSEWDRATGAKTYPQPPGVIELLSRRGFVADHAATKTKGRVHFEEYW